MPDLDSRREIADLFRILGDPTRLGIVYACLDAPMAAGDIADKLEISPSLASHHLRLLRAARLVRADRRGKHVYYSAADEHVSCVLSDMAEHAAEPVDEDHL
ncbi:MAG: winged helix-turn-helix transcriptional regulator [Rhodospirillales bacterium]|nr:winged helix-turn-helix transcriptional regulator [Rhodospirillales bacterium]MBO6785377.1 winged helix-turn-helix transcriptional regulator [Rhodospirillales bacterium]